MSQNEQFGLFVCFCFPRIELCMNAFIFSRGYNLYNMDVDYWRIYAGQHDITITDLHEAYYHVKKVYIHPGYDYTTLANGIALVVTSQTIQ